MKTEGNMILVQHGKVISIRIPLPSAAAAGILPLRLWPSAAVAGTGIRIACSPRTASRLHVGIADQYILADARLRRHHVQSYRCIISIAMQSLLTTATADKGCWHMRIFRRLRRARRRLRNKGMC